MIIRAITENTNKDGSRLFAVALVKSKRSIAADEIKLFISFEELGNFLKGAKL